MYIGSIVFRKNNFNCLVFGGYLTKQSDGIPFPGSSRCSMLMYFLVFHWVIVTEEVIQYLKRSKNTLFEGYEGRNCRNRLKCDVGNGTL